MGSLVGFEVLTAVTLQSTVFWVVTPCNLEFSRYIPTPSSRWEIKKERNHQKQATRLDIKDGDGMFLRNMGLFLNYTSRYYQENRGIHVVCQSKRRALIGCHRTGR
jgi:hypothetical protein